jgi:hypothetical protein
MEPPLLSEEKDTAGGAANSFPTKGNRHSSDGQPVKRLSSFVINVIVDDAVLIQGRKNELIWSLLHCSSFVA